MLSDDGQRAEYDRALRAGAHDSLNNFHDGHEQRSDVPDDAAARRATREYYEAFMRAEEEERKAQRRRERGLLLGLCSFATSLLAFLQLLWLVASDSAHLFPNSARISNRELARLPLSMEFKAFGDRIGAQHQAQLPRTPTFRQLAVWGLRTRTPYLRIALNRTSELRRAPDVGRPAGRGWLLLSSNKGEDIYGRPVDLSSNTLLHVPSKDGPKPWPATSLCARMLRSGPITQKDWWQDLSRASGGRLRTFALVMAPISECEAEYGTPTLAGATIFALLTSRLTVRFASRILA